MQIYGQKSLSLNLGLHRIFTLLFVITGVENPILGVDVFHKYSILVEQHGRRLVDPKTRVSSPGYISYTIQLCSTVTNMMENSVFVNRDANQ